jgi:hypothetical protein
VITQSPVAPGHITLRHQLRLPLSYQQGAVPATTHHRGIDD